jgi:WD40 repeat protein
LFFFLTWQWDKYEQLDFDRTLLKTAYQAADEGLRKRLAERARRAGRMEWIQVVVGGQQGRRLGEMTNEEWAATLATLGGSERWQEMWRLAQVAPVEWSARLLWRLKQATWVPNEEEERTPFAQLVQQAEKCVGVWGDLEGPSRAEPRGLVRCQATLKGHTGDIKCVAIDPEGQLLASGSTDNTVRLWRLPDGAALKVLEGHRGDIECLAISPDGQLLASASADSTVRLWRLPGGAALGILEGHSGPVKRLIISPDGRLLTSSGWDKTVRLWRLPDGAAWGVLEGHTGNIECLAIRPDGQLLASGSWDDKTVRLWRLPDRTMLKKLEWHTKGYRPDSLTVSPDARLLVVGDTGGTIQLFRIADGTLLHTLTGHTSWVECSAFRPDGQLLASGSWDKTVRLWWLPDGTPLATLEGHTGWVHCLAVSSDGRLLASGSQDATVRLWRLPDGTALDVLEEHIYSIECLAISPNGQLLVSGSSDKTVRLWDLEYLLLSLLPVGQTSLADMVRVEEMLRNGEIPDAEQSWLQFLLALMHWRRRFDVVVEDAPLRITVGDFDIEIGE